MSEQQLAVEMARLEATVVNDVGAAIEANLGTGWRVLYPKRSLHIETFAGSDVEVRLRDAPHIAGRCRFEGVYLKASEAFRATVGRAALEFLEAEQRSEAKEQLLRRERLLQYFDLLEWSKANWRSCRAAIWKLCARFALLLLCTFIQPRNYLAAVLLSLGGSVLFWSIGGWTIYFCDGADRFVDCRDWRVEPVALWIQFLFGILCIVVMTVRHCMKGFGWVVLILWPPTLYWSGVVFFSEVFLPWDFSKRLWCVVPLRRAEYQRRQRRKDELLEDFRRKDELLEDLNVNNSIIFKGKVRGSQPCVCSWPGKYESAWNVLVKSNDYGKISAAVVFLPEGSKDFGQHCDSPEGCCWCVPLYGERKPWGCMWWTLWMANIEKAVDQGAELEVYFFEKKQGQGKVESFETVGQENMHREAIYGRKAEFETSSDFRDAIEAGLGNLSKEKGADSSSQYSREWQRLFLAWLPEADRAFLEASEGLGNSQKAEVAWLEKKGYKYTEVEIDVAKWIRKSTVRGRRNTLTRDSDSE